MSILDQLDGAIRERLKSPVLGNLIIFWLVWNWKIFFYAFTAEGVVHSANAIELYLDRAGAFYLPLVFAIAYSLFYPLVHTAVNAVADFCKSLGVWIGHKLAGWTIVPFEEYADLRSRFNEQSMLLEELKEENVQLIDSGNRTKEIQENNERFQKKLQELEKENKDYREENIALADN